MSATKYPPYEDIYTYFAANFHETIVSSLRVTSNIIWTGNDANGAYVSQTTIWETTDGGPIVVKTSTGQENAIGSPIFELSGYDSSQLPISLPTGESNITNATPSPTPPGKTPEEVFAYTASATALLLLVGEVGVPPIVTSILLASGMDSALTDIALGFLDDATDPADLNFTQIAAPSSGPTFSNASTSGLTAPQVAAFADMELAVDGLYGIPVAISTAFNRAQGAYQSQAPALWQNLQLDAFDDYNQLAAEYVSRIEADASVLGINTTCFARGTHIATPTESVAVECLSIGDSVITASGEIERIRWIGFRHVNCLRHPHPEEIRPVRIVAGAFGAGLPRRDLFISPDHAMFVGGVLIPAKHLINGTSVTQMPVNDVTYFHIELKHHDLLLAEGLPAKSYLDVGDRANFSNNGDIERLFADCSSPTSHVASLWEMKGCAPLVITGALLTRARDRLVAIADTLGGLDARSHSAFRLA